MSALIVAPIFDVVIGFNGLNYHFLFRLSESQDKVYLKERRYVKRSAKPVSLYRADNAATQALFRRTQENALCRYSVVAAERLGYARIAENDNICRGAFAFIRAGPVLQITGPGQMWKNESILFRLAGKDVPERLQIGRRSRKSSKVNKLS